MNIFNVLSMGKSRLHETSMSAMLAYLLSPYQDHGVGKKFLKSFLELANEHEIYAQYIDNIDNGNIKVEIDLEVAYYHNNKRNDIDVQIKFLNNKNEEVHRILIENKIKSGAANAIQLKSYYDAVISNNEQNDDSFELEKECLSVIFLTPDLKHNILRQEFENLELTRNKVWIYWSSIDHEKNSVAKLVQEILRLEQIAEISPINDYMRHTFKAFTYYLNQTIDKQGKNRVNENLGNVKEDRELVINNNIYKIILRDSGQIQLFNNDGEKVVARPLLINFLEENQISQDSKCNNTRCLGKTIIKFLKNMDIRLNE